MYGRCSTGGYRNIYVLGNKLFARRSIVVKCLHGSFRDTYRKRCAPRPALGPGVRLYLRDHVGALGTGLLQ